MRSISSSSRSSSTTSRKALRQDSAATIALALTLTLGHAAGRRADLRHHGRPLRAPPAADDQHHLLRRDVGAVAGSRRPTWRSSSCGCCSASAWAASGASVHRSCSNRRRRGCAGCCRASCRRATRSATCSRRSRSSPSIRRQGARPGQRLALMFFLGGLPALLSLFIRAKVKESEAWHEHRTDWARTCASLLSWRRFLYLVLLMTVMGFMSHGTQDLYPTFLRHGGYTRRASPTSRCCRWSARSSAASCSATLGPVRPAPRDDTAARCALVVVPLLDRRLSAR